MEHQHLTPLGAFVKFLSWFAFIPMIIAYFMGYETVASVSFFVWLIAGILTWIVKI